MLLAPTNQPSRLSLSVFVGDFDGGCSCLSFYRFETLYLRDSRELTGSPETEMSAAR